MKGKAFTLLELLVVITIIGILSSIVIVSMSGSTDSATIAKGKAYAQQVHALLGANAVGVWNFDEGIGTTLTDISGYGNNGTLGKGANGTGLDWVFSDIGGTALQFDGVDDYVNCGNDSSLDLTSKGTIIFWAKISSYDHSTYWHIFGKGASAGWDSNGYSVWYNNSAILGSITDRSKIPTHNSVSFGKPETDVWHHFVLTWNGSRVYSYLNGIVVSSTSQTLNVPVTTYNLLLGRTPARYFSGLLDDFRVYAESMPVAEIQKHYAQGLENLLANQVIPQTEYYRRMEGFNKSLASSL